MATQTTNYQCPACTGPLKFSAKSGKLECEYCDSSFEVKDIEQYYAEKEARAAAEAAEEAKNPGADTANWDDSDIQGQWEEGQMRSFSCPSCGAELICDANTAASACPYCGNPTVIPGRFSGQLKPDYVIPFRLEKNDAIAALKKHYKGKVFLPGTFLAENTIEKIQGVYVPFWLYDGEAHGNMAFHTHRTRLYRQGDKEITETSHFLVERSGSVSFEKIPVDASTKMPDEYMESIEPFDYGAMKAFSTAYLPGFLADKYDLEQEDGNRRADQRCKETLEQLLRETVVGYDACVTHSSNIRLRRGKVHYALLPVWMLSVRWNNESYLFAINGQTGKTAGNLPISYGKVAAMFAGLSLPFSLLAYLLSQVLG